MKISIHHIHLNVSNASKSLPFYKDLLGYLGYRIVDESPDHMGTSNGTTDLWIVQAHRKRLNCPFHRQDVGLNHIAFRVSTKKAVNQFIENFLEPKKLKPLYGSPRHFPEYRKGYYAVYFEDPDRVKLEVVYFPTEKLKKKKIKSDFEGSRKALMNPGTVGIKNSERILILHKPKGFEVSRPKTPGNEKLPGRRTVYSLLPAEFHAQGWVPVGRLDKESTGLLMFVREGFLVHRLQTPRNIDKVYEVWVKGHLKPEHVENILQGVQTPIGILKAKAVQVQGVVGPNSLVKVVLDEGKNRQIRRMFAGLKDVAGNKFFKALDLTRTSFGPIYLDIEPGQWRFLTEAESEAVLKSVPRTKQN